jgi:hypothetical protein
MEKYFVVRNADIQMEQILMRLKTLEICGINFTIPKGQGAVNHPYVSQLGNCPAGI